MTSRGALDRHRLTDGAPEAADRTTGLRIDTAAEWPETPVGKPGEVTASGASLRVALIELFSGTPGRLRLWGMVLTATCLAFGIIGGLTSYNTSTALDRARDDTAQVFRSQNIYASLMLADATAANSFLVAGAERPADRTTYDEQIESASRTIAEALAAQPADARPLTALNSAITRYTARIDYARAENRSGLIVGAEYQRVASAQLRQSLPLLLDVRNANETRTQRELEWPGVQAGVLLGASAATIVLLLSCAAWMIRRFNRWINTGLGVAALLVFAGAAVAVPVQLSIDRQLDAYRTGPLADTIRLSDARLAAYDARSLEGLSLIARDADTTYASPWASAYHAANAALTSANEDTSLLRQYEIQHRQIVALDRKGEWSAARDLAVGLTADTFLRLDHQITERLGQERATSAQALAPRPVLKFMTLALPTLGLVSGLCVLRGISQRLREYR